MNRRSWIASLALVLLAPAGASAQTSFEDLLARFAASPGFEARFQEEKRIALLAVPVRSEGRIYFANPDRLLRRVERPEPSVALIADGQLRMRQGARVDTLDIASNPVLRGFIDSFRAVLAGDRAALERYHRVDFRAQPNAQAWELRLTPRDAALRRFLREIRLNGEGVTLREMRMIEVNGDETRTIFSDVDTARRYSAAEARRVFRLPNGP